MRAQASPRADARTGGGQQRHWRSTRIEAARAAVAAGAAGASGAAAQHTQQAQHAQLAHTTTHGRHARKLRFAVHYRACFFPIVGKAIWGWIDDFIDACTIAGSIAGVCTSLGLGAQQVVPGAQRINWIAATCVEAAAEVTGNMTAASDPDLIDCLSEGDIAGRRVLSSESSRS